jgi:ATP-GRASP peptide maturase of grasp-with-spasm system
MILIFSEDSDHSTTKVMEYLFYLRENVRRINIKDIKESAVKIRISNDSGESTEFRLGEYSLQDSNIKSIWFRRGGFFLKSLQKNHIRNNKRAIEPQIAEHMSIERNTLRAFIYGTFWTSGIRILGNPFVYNTQKLSVLKKAALLGLTIPDTLVTTRKEDLAAFFKRNDAVITKAIQDNVKIKLDKELFGTYTEEITKVMLDEIPESFLPSLFQEKLDKVFEIRVFYLVGQFYSLAIFSQDNHKTKVDFRRYDKNNPNRTTAFKLPLETEEKLILLLNDLNLNTASLDLVYDKKGRYVFLEINPVGQFDNVGQTMNYQLDKKIALWLAQKEQ